MNNGFTSSLPLLLVDDDESILKLLKVILKSSGVENVTTINDSRNVVPFLKRNNVSAIVMDLKMPNLPGQQLLQILIQECPGVPIIILTAANQIETAIECMRIGAYDYLTKPLDHSKFLASVKRALEVRSLNDEVLSLKSSPPPAKLAHESDFAQIISCNKSMRELFRYIEVIAISRLPVLISGETGVGKELFARAIHNVSKRLGPFIAVNVAGLDDLMFSDTLFGHTKGAFTGADRVREGLVSKAAAGSLFLDEIGDLAEASQIKLLRLIQEQEYYRLGSDTPAKSTTRLILATNRDLKGMISGGNFRKDLYYRLCSHQIIIPPLRDRPEDIPLLLDHFIENASLSLGRTKPTYRRELLSLLATYEFPGNVRELQAMVHDVVAMNTTQKLTLEMFKRIIQRERTVLPGESDLSASQGNGEFNGISFAKFPTLKEAETELIDMALKMAKGNQGVAASLLGISRQALNNRLRRNHN